MRRLLLVASLLITSVPGIYAQEPVQLSLDDCMNYAMKHNYQVKNAQLDVQIQAAQNAQTTALAYPQINGKAELDDYLNAPVTFFPSEFASFIPGAPPAAPGSFIPISLVPKYSTTANISGAQTLFDGSVLVALQARKTVMELARQNKEVTKENIRYNVFRAYHSLAIAYRQFAIIKSTLSYARQLEHDITVTQQTGFAEKVDVERTSVQVNNLATDSLRVGSLLAVSEQALKYAMGMDINTPIVLTDTAVDARKAEAFQLLEEESSYNRVPEFNLVQTQLSLNEYNVKRYKLAALPTLTAFGNVGYNYASNTFEPLLKSAYIFSSIVGLQLNVPIFNGLLRVSRLREARLNVEKSANSIEYMKQSIDFNVAQARTSLKNAALQAESQHRNLDLAMDVLDLTNKKYKAGVGSNQEVSQAQTDLLQAQSNYFTALMNVVNAEADLKKALGLLSSN